MEKIGVFIVDNSTIFREGLRQSFAQIEDIEVVGDSNLDEEVLELVMDFSPQVVLLDIGLPLLKGLSLIRQITLRSPAISVIALTPYNDNDHFFQAIKSGVAGYLSKNATADELAWAIRRIHQGENIITEAVLARPEVAERVLKQFQALSSTGKAIEKLTAPVTPRELEVLDYVAHGHSNKQIAHKLGISEQTIKNHMSSILRKLDANDRTQAVVLAIHYGWISDKLGEGTKATKQ